MLVVTRNAGELKKPIRALLASDDRPDGFFLNLHDTPSSFMVGRETLRVTGKRDKTRIVPLLPQVRELL